MVSCLILLNFTVADKLLGKQYKELVEVSKLLTPEDFWDNYGSQHQQFLPESKRKGEALFSSNIMALSKKFVREVAILIGRQQKIMFSGTATAILI
jgi:hypothetical protein